jgi:para-aminobenzoate synthetase/4-amino-4-deoxychorismate lyase
VYTGATRHFSPDGDAVLSVPIRTIVLEGSSGEMGVGSGVVADSIPLEEYDECVLKISFLTRSQPDLQLLESLRWDGQHHFLREHLERLKSSAE